MSFSTVVTAALLLGVAIVAYLLPSARAQNQAAITPQKAEFVPGELLVRFRPGTASARNKARTSLGLSTLTGRTLRVEVNHFGGSELVEGLMLARVAPEDAPAAINALRARADVEYAEPNFIRYPDLVPNDTHYQQLWGLKNGAGISAESAWNTTTGSGSVVVGIVDSGIDIQHRDLKDNIFVNPGEIPGNNVDDDSNGFIDDVNGWDFINHDRTIFDSAAADFHGTHVAGTIGAQGNNAAGVVGVNWDVQLLPLKAVGPQGGSDASLLEAFNYARALRQRGVNLRVLNNSYGAQHFSQSLLDAIKQLGDAGILFVAAAGNFTLNNDVIPHFPGSFDLPNVIAVAASTEFGDFASIFSNRGLKTVHLSAPGTNILSTTPRGYSGEGLIPSHTEADGSTYSNFSGTSMATPHVTGAAALACSADPNISLARLRGLILSGVDPGVGFTITGGRLNASKVVQSALENDNTPPAVPANFRIASQNGRHLELRWTEAGDDGTTARASLNEIRFTDTASNEQFRLNSLTTLDPGTERTAFVSIPTRHPAGQLSLRTSDNVGNANTATVDISLPLDVSDPYLVSLAAPAPLTTPNSGTIVGPRGDDVTAINFVNLPFPFPFFGFVTTTVVPSSNGALYIPSPPDFALPHANVVSGDFAVATGANLEGLSMVAGMWADLRTDRNATDNVYMVQPDPDRVIFRWQGVTFGAETPVNFEIELRRDGTIQTRYGSGNANLNPVIVGISAGDPKGYLVDSHSSETGPLSLGNAQTVTFALRNPPPPPSADLKVSVSASPNPVISGQNMAYNVSVANLGPSVTLDMVMTDVLPAGTTFVSCTTNFIQGTCTGPPVGSNGTVTGRINQLGVVPHESSIVFTIVVKVTAAPGTTLTNTPSATSFRPDPNPANNSASVISHVVAESFFNSARAIAAGRSHTTSVRNDGTVWNWGTGDSGQLGDGNSGIGVRAVTPVQVSGLEGVDTVADANGFVYALKSDGTVWAWGTNNEGQLGDGTTTSRPRPVQTLGLTNVKAVDAANFYGAALKTDGTVWHWGASNGLISNNFAVNTTPVQLNGIDNVSAIATGGGHLLMLKTDKTVWAIGVNSMGQLGDGTSTTRHTPVQVTGLSNVARIAAGTEFSLALKEDGTIWAWGYNFNGALGPNGGSMDFSPHPNPVQVTGLPAGMVQIAAGEEFCLAIASDGTVWGWGNNSRFQLGPGNDFGGNPTPRQIPNFTNVVAVAGGRDHSVALKTDGSVWSWGSNSQGECGDGSTELRFNPVRVSGLEAVSSPSLNPPGGGFNTVVNVTVTCATPGAVIHYTINGGEPTENDPVIASGGTVRLTFFSFLHARAFKPGLIPSGTSSATFNISLPPPELVVDETGPSSDQVSAMDAALLVRDPFPVVNSANPFRNANDPNTRVILFARNVELATGQTAASVGVILTDSNNVNHHLNAEALVSVPNTDLWQVVFRLPNNLSPGTYQVKIVSQLAVSNARTIRIRL